MWKGRFKCGEWVVRIALYCTFTFFFQSKRNFAFKFRTISVQETSDCWGKASFSSPVPYLDGAKNENYDNIEVLVRVMKKWYEVKQVQPVWLWLLWCKWFGGTFESAQLKVEQMQPMWLCILSGRQFKDTYENAQWIKDEQMQQMWICLFPGRQLEGTYAKTQWGKFQQMQAV